jgi:hypothetical protein
MLPPKAGGGVIVCNLASPRRRVHLPQLAATHSFLLVQPTTPTFPSRGVRIRRSLSYPQTIHSLVQ